jgi:hypothetical protein
VKAKSAVTFLVRAFSPEAHGTQPLRAWRKVAGYCVSLLLCFGSAGAQTTVPATQVNYIYDNVGRLTTVDYSNANTIITFSTYSLDAAGNRTMQSEVVPAVLAAPGNLVATPLSGSAITLNWIAPAGNAGTVTYTVTRAPGGLSVTTNGTSFPDSGLQPSTTYTYTVIARTATQISALATISRATLSITPTNLVVSSVTTSSVGLNWTAPTSTSPPVSSYQVWRSGGGISTFTQVGTTASTAYTDTTVVPLQTYSFYVIAVTASSTSPASNTVSATVPGGTFSYVSSWHTSKGSALDIATLTVKNTGSSAITGITWACSGGSFVKYGTGATSLAAGASTSYQCQANAGFSYTASITLNGVGASNRPPFFYTW